MIINCLTCKRKYDIPARGLSNVYQQYKFYTKHAKHTLEIPNKQPKVKT